MKKVLIGIYLLLSWPIHSMFMVNNICNNWTAYQKALTARFDKNRIVTGSSIPYMETALDFTPVIGAVLTESGIVEKCIQAIPYGNSQTKHKIANSIKNGTRTAFGVAILNSTRSYNNNSKLDYSIQSTNLPPSKNSRYEHGGTICFPKTKTSSWSKKEGIPFVSPAKNALIYTGIYVATDLGIQAAAESETVQKAIDAIPGARTVHEGIKNNVNIAPGTGAALMVCGITWLARTWMGK